MLRSTQAGKWHASERRSANLAASALLRGRVGGGRVAGPGRGIRTAGPALPPLVALASPFALAPRQSHRSRTPLPSPDADAGAAVRGPSRPSLPAQRRGRARHLAVDDSRFLLLPPSLAFRILSLSELAQRLSLLGLRGRLAQRLHDLLHTCRRPQGADRRPALRARCVAVRAPSADAAVAERMGARVEAHRVVLHIEQADRTSCIRCRPAASARRAAAPVARRLPVHLLQETSLSETPARGRQAYRKGLRLGGNAREEQQQKMCIAKGRGHVLPVREEGNRVARPHLASGRERSPRLTAAHLPQKRRRKRLRGRSVQGATHPESRKGWGRGAQTHVSIYQ